MRRQAFKVQRGTTSYLDIRFDTSFPIARYGTWQMHRNVFQCCGRTPETCANGRSSTTIGLPNAFILDPTACWEMLSDLAAAGTATRGKV
jgi:hypothetical protein